MSKFDETRENFIEWQAARIKELKSQISERDETIKALKAEIEALTVSNTILNTYLAQWDEGES